MKIGYQGVLNSNSYNATRIYIKNNNINAKLIPLISSKNVVNNLIKKEIDIGVCAIRNSVAGEVKETINALQGRKIKILDKIALRIHHSLFTLNNTISFSDIKYIASHEQALAQCKNYINNKFNFNIKLIKKSDTAICADDLKNGFLNSNTAIIVNKEAGISRGLYLLEENIEDSSNNSTEFIVFKIISKDGQEK